MKIFDSELFKFDKSEFKLLLVLLLHYLIWIILLTIGSCLFVYYKKTEALGGLVMGLTALIFGIIIPFHFKKIGLTKYKFFPESKNIFLNIIIFIVFSLFFFLVYPFGILGNKLLFSFINNIPDIKISVFTFLSLLFAAVIYIFIFWGGLLHSIKRSFGIVPAIIITSILFSFYHISQFPFTPLKLDFFILTFIASILLTCMTIINKSILFTFLIHQFGHFLHFVKSKDNPFTEPIMFIMNIILLCVLFGLYLIIIKVYKSIKIKKKRVRL